MQRYKNLLHLRVLSKKSLSSPEIGTQEDTYTKLLQPPGCLSRSTFHVYTSLHPTPQTSATTSTCSTKLMLCTSSYDATRRLTKDARFHANGITFTASYQLLSPIQNSFNTLAPSGKRNELFQSICFPIPLSFRINPSQISRKGEGRKRSHDV